jgi:hypothetical protein
MKFLFSLLLLISTAAYSYDQVLFVGAGGGINYGVSETPSGERSLGQNIRINAVYTNLIGQWVSAELGFNYMWEEQEPISGFEMTGFQGDLRAKVYPLSFLGWNIAPYFSGGVGFLNYTSTLKYDPDPVSGDPAAINAEPKPTVLQPSAEAIAGEEFTGITPVFAWGAGITWVINQQWAVEGSFNHSFTGTDEINPWRDIDETNDAYYLMEFKVIYNLGDIFGVDSGDEE